MYMKNDPVVGFPPVYKCEKTGHSKYCVLPRDDDYAQVCTKAVSVVRIPPIPSIFSCAP